MKDDVIKAASSTYKSFQIINIGDVPQFREACVSLFKGGLVMERKVEVVGMKFKMHTEYVYKIERH